MSTTGTLTTSLHRGTPVTRVWMGQVATFRAYTDGKVFVKVTRTVDGVGGVKESWGILPLGVASLYSRV